MAALNARGSSLAAAAARRARNVAASLGGGAAARRHRRRPRRRSARGVMAASRLALSALSVGGGMAARRHLGGRRQCRPGENIIGACGIVAGGALWRSAAVGARGSVSILGAARLARRSASACGVGISSRITAALGIAHRRRRRHHRRGARLAHEARPRHVVSRHHRQRIGVSSRRGIMSAALGIAAARSKCRIIGGGGIGASLGGAAARKWLITLIAALSMAARRRHGGIKQKINGLSGAAAASSAYRSALGAAWRHLGLIVSALNAAAARRRVGGGSSALARSRGSSPRGAAQRVILS